MPTKGLGDSQWLCDGVSVSAAVRRVPPHFSILPESSEVASGGSVNLTCVAVGSPMPHVKWRLGAVELTPENALPIGKNVLQLTDVRETATYTCVAASDLGNIEYDAEIRVKGTEPCVAFAPGRCDASLPSASQRSVIIQMTHGSEWDMEI